MAPKTFTIKVTTKKILNNEAPFSIPEYLKSSLKMACPTPRPEGAMGNAKVINPKGMKVKAWTKSISPLTDG